MGLVVGPYVKDLDTPLLSVSGQVISARDCAGAIHWWGGIGAGKTSAAHYLAGAYLRAGMGGCVTATKFEDIGLWQGYAHKHGRSNSLVLVDGVNEPFNFLDYLLATQGMEGIGTVTEALMRIIDAARKSNPDASRGGGESSFWRDATLEALRYTVPPLYRADGSVSIPSIIRFVVSAPKSREQVESKEWKKNSFMYKKLLLSVPKVPMEEWALENACRFWSQKWADQDERTRANVVSTITATLDRFNHGRLNRMFCGGTTVVPELSFGGAVLLLAMPTTLWGDDGVIAQQLFKFIWQKAVLARNSLEPQHRDRFLFAWSDEAQDLVNSYDYEFLSLCRSSKCCVCYLTQSLPTYTAKMGDRNAKDAAMALAGKFMTHVFCSNSCPETNEFAAKMLGRVMTRHDNYSKGKSKSSSVGMNAGNSENTGDTSSHGYSSGKGASTNSSSGSTSGTGRSWGENRGHGSGSTESVGCTYSPEYVIEPGDFGRMLKTGGTRNARQVTAVWYQAGRVFQSSGTNWVLARFKQE